MGKSVTGFVAIIVAGIFWSVAAVALMPCPDCGHDVSSRALMCPACGLKGEIIAAEAARLAKAKEPPPPDDAILADVGARRFKVQPVTSGGRPYALIPIAELKGLATLTLSFVSTNVPIAYTAIEVNDRWARLAIDETNLLFKAESEIVPQAEWRMTTPRKFKEMCK